MKKEIVTNIALLRKPCEPVQDKENIKPIIQDLKDSLDPTKGYALSSNQLGYNKRIFYVKFPKIDPKTKQISYEEMIVINPKIVEKLAPFRFKQEGCLSLPGLKVDTLRYNFIIVECLDEHLKQQTHTLVGLRAVIFLHEYDHLNGKTIFDRKYKNTKT